MANYITVSDLNNYLRRKFEADRNLDKVYLKGEISNFKLHSRGHMYFSLKDDNSVISAIMFQTYASNLKFVPKDGTKVFVEGKVTVYESTGKYQIVITDMQPDGIGALYIAYEKLKKELEAEGLFKKEHKRPIPKYPKTIGIVTAPTGAAIRDILSTIKRRYPICNTILFPALVQGESAKFSIRDNIIKANEYDIDLLIVGRGGGSIEDLWAFNEEIVARAIYNSKVPVISAVGHEVDFTIADYVADLRAPTPTGAAELAVPNLQDLFKMIDNFKIRLNENIQNKINMSTKILNTYKNSYVLKNPMSIYEVKEQKLSNLIDRVNLSVQIKLDNSKKRFLNLTSSYVLKNPLNFYEKDREKLINIKSQLNNNLNNIILNNKKQSINLLINKLELLNPLNILKNGYSVVNLNNKSIKDVKELSIGDNIDIRLHNGTINANILDIKEQ